MAFDSDLRRPFLERLMGNPEGWPSKAQRERLMSPWTATWTVGGLMLFMWGVFHSGAGVVAMVNVCLGRMGW